MFHRIKRLARHVRIGWQAFRDASKPIPYVPCEPTLLADVPGDTVFYVIPASVVPDGPPALLSKGIIHQARIEENGSLSYAIRGGEGFFGPDTWTPAHLCVSEDGYKRWLGGLLEEHGYKPLKMEHIRAAVEKLVVSESIWEDLLGPAAATKEPIEEEPADASK